MLKVRTAKFKEISPDMQRAIREVKDTLFVKEDLNGDEILTVIGNVLVQLLLCARDPEDVMCEFATHVLRAVALNDDLLSRKPRPSIKDH
jgi:hypothetical protein